MSPLCAALVAPQALPHGLPAAQAQGLPGRAACHRAGPGQQGREDSGQGAEAPRTLASHAAGAGRWVGGWGGPGAQKPHVKDLAAPGQRSFPSLQSKLLNFSGSFLKREGGFKYFSCFSGQGDCT